MKKILCLMFASFIVSCSNNNITNKLTNSSTNIDKELNKVKIKKHEALNIYKETSNTENKSEMEKLKSDFSCSYIDSPPEYFETFEPKKNVYICSTFARVESTVLPIYDKTYLVKEDNTYKRYNTLKEIFSPVTSKEEALVFALSSNDKYKTNNNVEDITDLLRKHRLSSNTPYQSLSLDKFPVWEGLKVFKTEINETFVEVDKNEDYIVNLFLYDGNFLDIRDCKPILWEIIVQVTKDGNVKELSKTKIIEDAKVNNCLNAVI
ncbi:MAG: hypothetical protein U0354_07660 [Candidatus Sericytochromatia bacterium]